NLNRLLADGECECDKDYHLDVDSLTCKPTCNYTCENGLCIAPNTCECLPGYKKSPHISYFCIPHCKNNCNNGQCTAPDFCICNPGYNLNKELGVCLPQCDNCQNGLCLHIRTFVSVRKVSREKTIAVYLCAKGDVSMVTAIRMMCAYAKPGIRCLRGTHVSLKRTLNCVNGWCKTPDLCECQNGYVPTLDSNRCEEHVVQDKRHYTDASSN
ncbi:hypothetical protein L9F63_028147, partial [Diploptera punctata]